MYTDILFLIFFSQGVPKVFKYDYKVHRTVEVQIIMLTYRLFVYSYYWIQYPLPALTHPLLWQFFLHSPHPPSIPSLYRYISYTYSVPAIFEIRQRTGKKRPLPSQKLYSSRGDWKLRRKHIENNFDWAKGYQKNKTR